MHICWSAQAGLYYHYGIEKQVLPQKLSGIFSHTVCAPENPLMAGFDDVFTAPHSRYSAVETAGIRAVPELEILAESGEAGVYAIWAKKEGSCLFWGIRNMTGIPCKKNTCGILPLIGGCVHRNTALRRGI